MVSSAALALFAILSNAPDTLSAIFFTVSLTLPTVASFIASTILSLMSSRPLKNVLTFSHFSSTQPFRLSHVSDILVPIGSIIDSLINPPSELNPPDIVSQIALGKLLIFSHHHLIPSNNICGKRGIALNISINAGKPVVFNHSNTGFKTLSISFF